MTDRDPLNKDLTAETKAGIGILVGALAAAGLAAVYLYGTQAGETHRKQLNKRLRSIKKDVVAELKKLQKVDKEVYVAVIDDVVSRYQQMGEVDAEEVIAFAKELKHHYETIRQEAAKPAAKKTNKKTRRTTSKKVAKKTAKKKVGKTSKKTATKKDTTPSKKTSKKTDTQNATEPSAGTATDPHAPTEGSAGA